MRIQKTKIILFLTMSWLLVACHVQAATIQPEIFLHSSTAGEYKVSVFLDTKGVYANTVAGSLRLPEGVQIQKIEPGPSIIDFWIDTPEVTKDGVISFSGMTPGGFISSHGLIFSVLVTANTALAGEFSVSDAQVYAHDGLGTLLESAGGTTTLSLVSKVGSNDENIDTLSPTIGLAEVVRDAALFDGDPAVVVIGLDPQSGIIQYEVRYGKIGAFTKIDMPFRIPESGYHDTLYIRITDGAGNERVVVLPPVTPSVIPVRKVTSAGLCVIVLIGFFIYLARSRRSKQR